MCLTLMNNVYTNGETHVTLLPVLRKGIALEEGL